MLFQECTVGIIGVVGRGVIRIEADGFHFLPQVTITYYINTGKLNLEVSLMNRRKTKKRVHNLYCLGNGNKQLFSYHEKREACRESHELSIDYARKEGRNYWDGSRRTVNISTAAIRDMWLLPKGSASA